MSRTLKVLIAVVVMLVLVFAVAGNTSASVEPQIVRVTLTDYQITLSQFVVSPGRTVTLVVTNDGDMAHKLTVRPYANPSANLDAVIENQVIGSHTGQTVQFKLEPGIYRIECGLVDHAGRGMVNAIAAQSFPQKSLPLQMEFIIPVLSLVVGSAYIILDSLGFRLTK